MASILFIRTNKFGEKKIIQDGGNIKWVSFEEESF